MGLLFDAVRREYENIIKFKEIEKTNFLESRKFDNYPLDFNIYRNFLRYLKTIICSISIFIVSTISTLLRVE